MRLPDLEAWAIFASVIDHRSFSAAADAIGLSKASVSKAVTRLENQLGANLFHRTSRRLTLTDTGQRLAEHARRLLVDAQAAEENAHSDVTTMAGLIRVSAPMSFGLLTVAPAIADFMADHPQVTIDLQLSDAKIDIVAEGVDIALRIADLPDSSLRARRLGLIPARVVAAPAYIERAGAPVHPAQLGDHVLVSYANARGPWRFIGPDRQEVSVRAEGRLRANSGDALLPALVSGIGIGMLPDFITAAELKSGALVPLLPGWAIPQVALHLMTPPGRLRPARVEALIEFLADRLAAQCSAR